MNFPKPLPGFINCISCHSLSVVGCEECRRCRERCGCICKGCWNCTPTQITEAGRRWVGDPVRHHPKYFCRVCGKCKRHNFEGLSKNECDCRSRPSRVKEAPFFDGAIFNTLERPLGLEIEVSYVGATRMALPKFVRYTWTHDGSITSGGQELVVEPLVGDNFLRGVTAMAETFALHDFAVDNTCGFHVHVGTDIRDTDSRGRLGRIRIGWGAEELRRLILLYYKFEDVFYALVQSGRDQLRTTPRGERKCYCARWDRPVDWYRSLSCATTGSEIRRLIMEWLYAGRLSAGSRGYVNMPQIRNHKYENCRYFGLNLHTWFQRGTVEYRHHEGTVSRNKLIYWPLWCGWFTELASVLTDREVLTLNSLDALLDSEWKRPYKVTYVPLPVREWVRKTLVERGREPRVNEI